MTARKSGRVFALLIIGAILVVSQALGQTGRPRYSTQRNDRSWTVPEGTVLNMKMDSDLTSRVSRAGDRFKATLTIPVYVNGRTVIPAGTVVEGRVTEVTPARRMSRSGTIAVDFDELVFPNGSRVKLTGQLTSTSPDDRQRIDDESRVSGAKDNRNVVFIGGGGAIGAVLGGIAGGGKGAVLGGIAGAGAGVAGVLLAKGVEAEVRAGTPFGIQLSQPLSIREEYVTETDGQPSAGAPSARDQSTDTYRDQPPDTSSDNDPSSISSRPDRSDRGRPSTRISTPEAQPPRATEPALPLSSPEMIRRAQGALREQGYYEGPLDGNMGPRTAGALRTYQREHNLPESGELDQQTARSLGITGATEVSDRRRNEPPADDVVLANVLSANASRLADGTIRVSIQTQANTGGWRWTSEHRVNGDTLEVYARGIRPTGMVTQVLTRGRIDLNVRDGVEGVTRVVVHGAGGETEVPLGGSVDPSVSRGIQRQAEDLLADYQRELGVRMTGTGLELNRNRYAEPEIQLLFALSNLANAAQLYSRMAPSITDPAALRAATIALARDARRTDRIITTTSGQAVQTIAPRWDLLRQDVLKLMQSQGIASSEIEER